MSSAVTSVDLQDARRLFWQEAPVAVVLTSLPEPSGAWAAQEAFVKNVLDHPTTQRFPPSPRYQQKVVRELVARAEAEALPELSDALFERLADLNAQPPETAGYLTFALPCLQLAGSELVLPLRMHAHHNEVGLRMWEAGFLLTDLVLRQPDLVRGRRVVELGAGLGLTGIAAACCSGAARVTLTDCAQQVLANLEHNAFLAAQQLADACPQADLAASSPLHVAALDWLDGGPHAVGVCDCAVDVILAADVIYDVAFVPALVQVIAALLATPSSDHRPQVALVAATERNVATLAVFLQHTETPEYGLVRRELSTEHLTAPPPSPFHYEGGAVRLFELTRRRKNTPRIPAELDGFQSTVQTDRSHSMIDAHGDLAFSGVSPDGAGDVNQGVPSAAAVERDPAP